MIFVAAVEMNVFLRCRIRVEIFLIFLIISPQKITSSTTCNQCETTLLGVIKPTRNYMSIHHFYYLNFSEL